MDQFFLPAVASFASGQVWVTQFIDGVAEVAFSSFCDNARFLCHPVFMFLSGWPSHQGAHLGFEKTQLLLSLCHILPVWVLPGCAQEGAEGCPAFVHNLRIDHLPLVPASLWHFETFFVVFKYFWLCLGFLSARQQWEPSLGIVEHMLKHSCPVYSFICQHSSFFMDLKAQIHSLLSMVLMLASYQSIFYYKMLTQFLYVI